MICKACCKAADDSQPELHKQCTGCDCQHVVRDNGLQANLDYSSNDSSREDSQVKGGAS